MTLNILSEEGKISDNGLSTSPRLLISKKVGIMPAPKYIVKIIKTLSVFLPLRPLYTNGNAHKIVSTKETIVHITVRITVHARDHVYFESLHTSSKAFKLKPFGIKLTSPLIKCSGALIDLAKTFIIGNRQTHINNTIITTTTKSPNFDLFKFMY